MSAGMAGVIAAHVLWMSGETETVWQPAEESAQCSCGHDYESWVHTAGGDESPDWDKEHAAHVAEELAKAGYGNVQEAKAEAWNEGRESFGLDLLKPAGDNGMRESSTNPYAPDPLAAALADPEGHALVKAIHDRKAGA